MKEITPKSVLIGYKLKQLRLAKGYTQGKIAEFLGVSPQHYGTLERGINTFSLDNILKLCDFYNVPIISIIGEIRSTDRKRKKESEKLLKQVDSLSDEHKQAVTHLVKFYAQLERKDAKSKEEKELKQVQELEIKDDIENEKLIAKLQKEEKNSKGKTKKAKSSDKTKDIASVISSLEQSNSFVEDEDKLTEEIENISMTTEDPKKEMEEPNKTSRNTKTKKNKAKEKKNKSKNGLKMVTQHPIK